MDDWWICSTGTKPGCCWVRTDGEIIVDTAPLWRRFVGQPLENLQEWLGSYEQARLDRFGYKKEEADG